MRRYIIHFWRSKNHAWRGVQYTFRHEPNFRVQVYIAVCVCIGAGLLQVRTLEFIILILLILAVLVLELFNTAIEALSDVVKPRLHEQVGLVKDIAAGMVLIASLAAIVIGVTIFYPYLLEFFNKI